MSAFNYHVAPNPRGGFTTRPVYAEAISEDAFFDLVAARCGKPPEDCASVFDAIVDTLVDCAGSGAHTTGLRGRLRFRPASGGSQPGPDDFNTVDEINADVAISLTAEKRELWRSTLSLQSHGSVGKVTPIVATTLSQQTGEQDKYQPGTLIELVGRNLRMDRSDPAQGVFFTSGTGPEIRTTVYGPASPTSIIALVPEGLSGPLRLRVAVHLYGSVRSFSYMTPITQ
jgi:Domain of unknown function (DUF4469) with IG-like fold